MKFQFQTYSSRVAESAAQRHGVSDIPFTDGYNSTGYVILTYRRGRVDCSSLTLPFHPLSKSSIAPRLGRKPADVNAQSLVFYIEPVVCSSLSFYDSRRAVMKICKERLKAGYKVLVFYGASECKVCDPEVVALPKTTTERMEEKRSNRIQLVQATEGDDAAAEEDRLISIEELDWELLPEAEICNPDWITRVSNSNIRTEKGHKHHAPTDVTTDRLWSVLPLNNRSAKSSLDRVKSVIGDWIPISAAIRRRVIAKTSTKLSVRIRQNLRIVLTNRYVYSVVASVPFLVPVFYYFMTDERSGDWEDDEDRPVQVPRRISVIALFRPNVVNNFARDRDGMKMLGQKWRVDNQLEPIQDYVENLKKSGRTKRRRAKWTMGL